MAKYKSLRGMVTTISTEEGLTAFWKGHMTAQYLSVIYMAIQFGLNEVLTRQMFEVFPSLKKSDSDTKILALARSACGAPAAVCATLASYPFDMMRTRKIVTRRVILPDTISGGIKKLACSLKMKIHAKSWPVS